jgi:hypothetical protein
MANVEVGIELEARNAADGIAAELVPHARHREADTQRRGVLA